MSKNNQNVVFEARHYERFDALPPQFRHLLKHADVDLTVGWIEGYIARCGQKVALALLKSSLRDQRRDLVLAHYGRQHPQARG